LEDGSEQLTALTEAIEKPKKLVEAFEAIDKWLRALPDPNHVLTSFGPGAAAGALAGPVAGIGVAAAFYLLKARADKEKKEQDRNQREQVSALHDNAEIAKWADEKLGLKGLDAESVSVILAEIVLAEAETTRTQALRLSAEEAEQSRNYLAAFTQYLAPRLDDMQDVVTDLRTAAAELIRNQKLILDKLDKIHRDVRHGHLALRMPEPQETTEDNRLLFSQRSTTLRGREPELKRLREFANHPAPFRFWILAGAGGVGKTRLAYEFADELWLEGWEVGFLPGIEKTDWAGWEPSRPTLVLVDYFLARSQPWESILRDLGRRNGTHKIRILLIERTADANTWSAQLADSSLRPYFHGSWTGSGDEKRIECLNLGGLTETDLAALFAEVAGSDSTLDILAAVARYRQIDPACRPLFAMLAAEAFAKMSARGTSLPEWSLASFIQHVLQELGSRWRQAGVDREHGHLLVLATLLGGLRLRPSFLDNLRSTFGDVVPARLSNQSCRHLASYSQEWDAKTCWLPPLLPDALGEAFVIWALKGDWGALFDPDADNAQDAQCLLAEAVRLDALANEYDASPLRDFTRRLAQDFPEGLAECSSLNILDLSGTWFSDLSPLKGLTQLSSVNLSGTHVSDLTPLTGLAQLSSIDLSGTRVSDLSPLTGLTQLRSISLSGTEVFDLSPLMGMTQLSSIDLSGRQVSDLSALTGLTQLSSINLSGTPVFDISPLTGLTQLSTINLSGTEVSDLSSLKGLTKMRSINLSGTEVFDLTPLTGLTQLSSFDLSVTPVSDLSPLTGLAQLTSISLSGTAVSDLSPLTSLIQITSINLSGTEVSDLSPLTGLTQVRSISLSGTRVSDLSPLTGLTQLSSINLSGTRVSDLSPLTGLTQLSSINLSGTEVFDLTPLTGLTQLRSITVSGTNISDLSPLTVLAQLRSIDLSVTQVSDLSPLTGLIQLTSINLSRTHVSDLSPLTGLAQLTSINLSGTHVSDLSPLRGLAQLTSINLSGTQIFDLTPLRGLAQLTSMNLSGTEVSDLSPLTGLTQLSSIDLYGTQVSDLSPLMSLTQLTWINLYGTQVSDLSPLTGLAQLKSIYLFSKQVLDLSPLTGLVQLKSIYLSGTQVSDLSPLTGLAQLTSIYLSGTQVSDLSPLTSLTQLRSIWLRGTPTSATEIAALRFALPHATVYADY
jgi:hypothetical protein